MNAHDVRPKGDTPGPAQPGCPVRHFSLRLSATRRGARLARRLATEQLANWGWPYDHELSLTVAHLVGELTANAVLHGRVPGRDFRLALAVADDDTVLRIEVTDARVEKLPPTQVQAGSPGGLAESGRGLLLVEALADRWGTRQEPPCTKTVWCELEPHRKKGDA
ncbi:ATP-binding protein [Streptomyces sp. TS71-3]|uniref:ATP-binding protein n=1 Tax=Streptomyces sp. TS71-3 TaxID=2733862 RepID=UPI001AFD8ECF|nr:ATP-binding protein [Streptomyces sp. TS71-3]GHJ41128.1 hypothetical protein Sm713_67370 [Streptomyces sp. TS71-3]